MKDYRALDRVYIPLDALAAAGSSVEALDAPRATPQLLACLHGLADRTGVMLEAGQRPAGADQGPPARAGDLRHRHAGAAFRRGCCGAAIRSARMSASASSASRPWARSAPRRDCSAASWPLGRAPGAVSRSPADERRHHPTETQSAGAPSRASGSSFYTAMRILPRAQREAMFEIYSFCRAGRRRRGFHRAARRAPARACANGARGIDALYAGRPPPDLRALAQAVRDFALRKEDFLAVIDGMEMDAARGYPRAGLGDARSLLRSRRERGRAAVGPGVRHGRAGRHRARAPSRPRVAAHQHPARHRRGRRASAGSICRARSCSKAGIVSDRAAAVLASPGWARSARRWPRARAAISRRPTRSWRAIRAAP